MNPNPNLLTEAQLATAPPNVILAAIYELLAASISLAFAIFIFYWIIRLLLWVLPHYWKRGQV